MELVASARALGFVATHISGSGEPDGVARFTDYPTGEKKIILEAKSSTEVPSLSAIDFAGLAQHMKDHQAQGCLLVAPSYPGSGNDSASSKRAEMLRVSCWTVEQLARVVEAASSRHLTAQRILDIVLSKFTPQEVTQAVNDLFREPAWNLRELYGAIINSLKRLNTRLRDSPRTVQLIAAGVSAMPEFENITLQQVQDAVLQLTSSSQGLLSLSGDKVIILGSFEEIERRLSGITGTSGEPRRPSNFRE